MGSGDVVSLLLLLRLCNCEQSMPCMRSESCFVSNEKRSLLRNPQHVGSLIFRRSTQYFGETCCKSAENWCVSKRSRQCENGKRSHSILGYCRYRGTMHDSTSKYCSRRIGKSGVFQRYRGNAIAKNGCIQSLATVVIIVLCTIQLASIQVNSLYSKC